jgi:hypothetical protein
MIILPRQARDKHREKCFLTASRYSPSKRVVAEPGRSSSALPCGGEQTIDCLSAFPSVCPEPVLVKPSSFLYSTNVDQNVDRFVTHTCGRQMIAIAPFLPPRKAASCVCAACACGSHDSLPQKKKYVSLSQPFPAFVQSLPW